MNINIKRKGIDLDKLKYELIIHKSYPAKIRYDWSLKGEYLDESLEDFHLFCISIVKDLFEKNFKTNEEGEHTYEIEDFDNEAVLEDLDYLFSIIADKKFKND